MSTKGMSVTAARQLVDTLCQDVPLLVLHDFDKSGFSIVGTLRRNTRRYEFENAIEVIDLGLRLADVTQWELQSEDVSYGRSDPSWNLQENGATDEEIEFLCQGGNHHYAGQRVELNAFTSDALIEWLEGKLEEHGIRKVIPDEETLTAAYRRALAGQLIREEVSDIIQKAKDVAARTKPPKGLAARIAKTLKTDCAIPWDQAIAALAQKDAAEVADLP